MEGGKGEEEWLVGHGGWLEDEGEKAGPAGETHVLSYVINEEAGWTATQIWGFQEVDGERRYARNIVLKKVKGEERVAMRLVYDYVGEN